jgi:hypothetical protein
MNGAGSQRDTLASKKILDDREFFQESINLPLGEGICGGWSG